MTSRRHAGGAQEAPKFPKRPSTSRRGSRGAAEDDKPKIKAMTPNEKKDALIEKLKGKCEEYRSKIEAKDLEIEAAARSLQSSTAEAEEALKRVEAQKMGKEKLLDAMGEEAAANRREIERLSQENARLEAKTARLKEVEETLARTKVALSDVEESLDWKGQEVVRQEAEIAELEAAIDAEKESKAGLAQECDDLRAELEEGKEVREQLELYKASMEEKETEVDTAVEEMRDVEKELRKRAERIRTLEAEVDSLNSVIEMKNSKAKNTRNDELQLVKDQRQRDVSRLEHKVEELESNIQIKLEKATEAAVLNEQLRMRLEAIEIDSELIRQQNLNLKQQIMEAGMEVSPMATTPPLSSSPQGDSAASPSTPSQAQRRLSLSLGGLPGSADRRRGSSADAFTLAAPVTPRT